MHKIIGRAELAIVALCISIYIIAASSVSLNRYWQINAFWYDFGILDTTIWKLSRFQLPYIEQLQPPLGTIVWGDHFNPSIIFVVPFYWITNRPEITLIAQSLFVGISGLIAYLLAKKATHSILISSALTTAYLGFVGIQNALFTDIHNIVFSLPFLMLTFWTIFEKRWKLYWIFFLISLGFQENIAGLGIGIGCYLLLRKDRNIKIGLMTIIVSILWAILTTQFIMPYFLGENYKYSLTPPATWYQWITSFFDNPQKVKAIFFSFATFGFMPALSFSTIPLLLEHFFERFGPSTPATRWDLGFHYNAFLSPILFIASLEVILKWQKNKTLKKLLPWWSVGIVIIVFFLHRFYLHGPLLLATHQVFYKNTQDAKFLDTFINQIPRNGLLMTQNNIAAHFTHDRVILLNKDFENIKPDYIAVDKRDGQNGNNFFPLNSQFDQFLASVSASPNYSLKRFTQDELIFTRK